MAIITVVIVVVAFVVVVTLAVVTVIAIVAFKSFSGDAAVGLVLARSPHGEVPENSWVPQRRSGFRTTHQPVLQEKAPVWDTSAMTETTADDEAPVDRALRLMWWWHQPSELVFIFVTVG